MTTTGARSIGWELGALLVLKALALGLLWLLFFPESRKPVVDADVAACRLLPASQQSGCTVPDFARALPRGGSM